MIDKDEFAVRSPTKVLFADEISESSLAAKMIPTTPAKAKLQIWHMFQRCINSLHKLNWSLFQASKENTYQYFFPETPVLEKNAVQRRTVQNAREDFRAMLENDNESPGIKALTSKCGPNFIYNDILYYFRTSLYILRPKLKTPQKSNSPVPKPVNSVHFPEQKYIDVWLLYIVNNKTNTTPSFFRKYFI